jgi:RNA polymerase sigma-70 factor (ECF subfamily)
LCPGGIGVIEASARGAWRDLDAKLRPFIALRVRTAADVDDVVQDVFLRIQRGVGGLRDDERFGPWAYQIARSAIADHHRMRARHPLASSDHREDELEVAAHGDAEPPDDDDDAKQAVTACVVPFVAMLPSPYREALTLTELEGLSQKDAAAMLGVSLSAIKSRVQRGRQRLRRSLEDCCHIALDSRRRVVGCEVRGDAKLSCGCRSQASASDHTCCD